MSNGESAHLHIRLFSRVQGRFAFGRMSNALNAGFLILSYCPTSLIFAGFPSAKTCEASYMKVESCVVIPNIVLFCPGALVALGIGLAGNTALTTWQLSSAVIPTWSSSPIDIVWDFLSTGLSRRAGHRCMVSVHEQTTSTTPRKPKIQQQSAWSAHREVRKVLIGLWILVILAFEWFGSLIGIIKHFSHI